MKATAWSVRVLVGGLFAASGLHAATPEEDEARIEALMRAELAATPAPAPGAATTVAVAEEPAPVLAEVIAPPPPPSSPNDDWLVPADPRDAGLPFADLARRIGRQVTIVTRGERVHRGTITQANDRQVTLEVRRAGGTATYALRRDQVISIAPR